MHHALCKVEDLQPALLVGRCERQNPTLEGIGSSEQQSTSLLKLGIRLGMEGEVRDYHIEGQCDGKLQAAVSSSPLAIL